MRKKYDCTKCLHEEICEVWREYEGSCAANFRNDGRCDYFNNVAELPDSMRKILMLNERAKAVRVNTKEDEQ